MPGPEETCIMCGVLLGDKATYTAALIFGNKSRDPHVGPYCEKCGPPAIANTEQCVEDCPVTGEKWTHVDGNCLTLHPKRFPWESIKCKFCLGRSPIRSGAISCIHPARMSGSCLKKEVEESD